ncbi:MAG: xanthine dehydrogenase family protein molybdopterin-binding subunit [Candidatus Latescibacteria bacterium]|nr:xanthine dehydrogenase family protein molybdopterin-binding subunit [Candidatus Latescibacterota bacterium]
MKVVGTSPKRIDGIEKVTGAAQYTGDIVLPRMIFGKIKRSPLAHAKILSIDTRKAEQVPGVRAVITAADLPDVRLGVLTRDEYLLAHDTVRFVGEPIAAVAADTPEIAREACEQMTVEYEELPALFDPEEAIALDPPVVLHEDYEEYERLIELAEMDKRPPNLWQAYRIRHGDIDAAFHTAEAEGGFILENRYMTGYVHTTCMEPRAAVAQWGPDGTLTVWAGGQSPYIARDGLSRALGLPPSKVRVIVPFVGGAFGGKLTVHEGAIAAALAKKARRPVKVVLTREEEFTTTSARTPFIFSIKDAVSHDGVLLGRKILSIFWGGAYSGEGFLKPIFSTHLYPGSYRLPALWVDSYGVYTNRIAGGALRGYGCAESAWAVETQMDIIARTCHIDPVALRMKNLLTEGERTAITMPAHAFSAHECLTKCAEAIEWGTPSEQPGHPWYRGKGIALGNKYSFAPTAASVDVKVHEDNTYELRTSAVDLGQGAYTVLTQIVADEFGVEIERVKLVTPDTAITPFDHVAGSSRQTFHTGNATRLACADATRQMRQEAAPQLGVDPDKLDVSGGRIFVKENPARFIEVGDLFVVEMLAGKRPAAVEIFGKATWEVSASPHDPNTGQGEHPMAYMGHGAQAAEVEVNVETGQVRVLKFVSAIDVGKAMNPQGVEMQNFGGACMGIGIALHEEMCFDEKGRMTNSNLEAYKIPTIIEMPRSESMQSIIVEVPHQQGPYGAKGAGEIVVVPTSPALGNAVYDAIGVRIWDLPLTPEKIVKVWQAKQREGGSA